MKQMHNFKPLQYFLIFTMHFLNLVHFQALLFLCLDHFQLLFVSTKSNKMYTQHINTKTV